MPGLNYAQWSAARIPPKGLVFGAIDPAMHAVGVDAQKETQRYAGQIARLVYPAAPAAIGSSGKKINRPPAGVKPSERDALAGHPSPVGKVFHVLSAIF